MTLTLAQLQVLKAAILADPAFAAQPQNSDGAFAIALAMNLSAVPDFWVWRTAVGKGELVQSTSVDGTTFTWVGNGFITRSVGEQTAWQELFGDGACNPSLASVRQAFLDIFSGSGNAAANRTHLAAMGRRVATRAEQLFAVGTGSTASPALMGAEGALTYQDVAQARNS
jgi:hypothetical protein